MHAGHAWVAHDLLLTVENESTFSPRARLWVAHCGCGDAPADVWGASQMSRSSVRFCAQRWMTRTARGGGWSAWTRWPPWRNSSPTWRSSKFVSQQHSGEGRMWTPVSSAVLVMTFNVSVTTVWPEIHPPVTHTGVLLQTSVKLDKTSSKS